MSYTQYHPDTDNTSANINQSRQDGEARANNMLATRSADHTASGDNSSSRDEIPGTLQTVTNGILRGVSPLQFMDSINAGNQQLGNRAFMRFVGELHARRQEMDTHRIAAKGLQGSGRPLTHLDTLQRAFGHHDISGMREHTGHEAETALDMLGADGYANDGRMAFADTPDLYTQAHEAAHGVQQATLGNSLQLKGGVGEVGDQYETHADAVAEGVVRGESVEGLLDEVAGGPTVVVGSPATATGPVQMMYTDKESEDEEEDRAGLMMTLMGHAIEVKKGGRWGRGRTNPSRPSGKVKALAQAATEPKETEVRSKKKDRTAPKKAQAGKGGAKGKAKQGKLTLDQIPGLDDMFLARTINHLITGELYELDPMIGDEGCQIRTPFILDMYSLVQAEMPESAVELVHEYRSKVDSEQSRVLKDLEGLERDRTNPESNYQTDVSAFINSEPLKVSVEAISGEYETMFKNLTSVIEQHYPESVSYLRHVCSEASIYWEDVLDHFGISMLTDRHPIFPNTLLARRKRAQSKWSKKYMAEAASKLLLMGGGTFSVGAKELGPDKKGTMQTAPSFLMAQSKKENIAAMLLHAVQMHSGAAVTKGERLELGPYWETTRLALTYALKQGYPLLVNLRRLIVSGEGANREYSSTICRTLFYEPTDEGYKYQPNPSEAQRSQGALLFQGFSMLRKGDTGIPGAILPIAPWVFEEDPEKFLTGFTACDVANLMLLGDVGTHHPLNTGGSGSGAYAYGLPGVSEKEYSFGDDPGGWKYADAIHDLTLSDLVHSGMTQQGQEYLTPEFELTDKSKGLLFPDQCPVNIAGTGSEFNIKEEYQLMKLLCQAAGMKETMYSKEDRNTGTAERVAQTTIPFVNTHILASTFAHENEISQRFALSKTRGITESLDELRVKKK